MGIWNYRLIYHPPTKRLVGETMLEVPAFYAIHEVYYDDQGVPEGVSNDSYIVGDEVDDMFNPHHHEQSKESIYKVLGWMKECMNKAVLIFPNLKLMDRLPEDTVPTPPVQTTFEQELVSLINRYSKENESNTPDFVLGEYLGFCLRAFNLATRCRDNWYGIHPFPGCDKDFTKIRKEGFSIGTGLSTEQTSDATHKGDLQ